MTPVVQQAGEPTDEPTLAEALRIFIGCAYPVATEIDPKGYRWSSAYLDQALPIARAALASRPQQPQAETPLTDERISRNPGPQVHAALRLLREVRDHKDRHLLPRDWLTKADEVLGTWGPVKLPQWMPCMNCGCDSTGKITHCAGCPNAIGFAHPNTGVHPPEAEPQHRVSLLALKHWLTEKGMRGKLPPSWFEALDAGASPPEARADAGWISVKDRVPEDGQEVVVLYWPYNNRENRQCVMGAVYDASRDTYLTDTDGDDAHPPSHWMPLPLSPEAQEPKDAASCNVCSKPVPACICPPADPCNQSGG